MISVVVDTNVLFTFFWKNSVAKNVFTKHRLIAPELALKEIEKYSSEIIKKTGISNAEFNSVKKMLPEIVRFVPLEEYKGLLKEAVHLADGLTKEDILEFMNDIDFFALALKLNYPIWTNDKLFKKQTKVLVFTTQEIIELTR